MGFGVGGLGGFGEALGARDDLVADLGEAFCYFLAAAYFGVAVIGLLLGGS